MVAILLLCAVKPVNNRVKIWCILLKNGALPFKGSIYLLPYSNDHLELLRMC